MFWAFYRRESSFAFSQSVIQGFALMAQAQSYFLRWHFRIVWYPKQGLEQSMKGVFFQLSMKISPLSACSCPFSEAIELLTDTLPHTRLTKEQMLETLGISLPLLNVWTAYIWAEINMLWQSVTVLRLILSSWCGSLLTKGCISCWCLRIATVFAQVGGTCWFRLCTDCIYRAQMRSGW